MAMNFHTDNTVIVSRLPLKIGNLVHETIIMLLPYSNTGHMKHKSNALSTDPARKTITTH